MHIATPEEAQDLLDKYGIPYARTCRGKDYAEIQKASWQLRKPLVLKLVSKQAVHKTERGLVRLNIHDMKELREQFEELNSRSEGLQIEEYLLQEQREGVEFIIGGKEDPSFGKVLVFGLGGIFVELLKERALRVLPISSEEIAQMIMETKAGAFVKGHRNKRVSLDRLVEIIYKTSELIQAEDILELDFNPVIANEGEVAVVDARIVLK
ncbi:MAG TPA: acetate--CoA ligase family protein [Candidatus Norongarragalinales archaeon]|nr:acetate--CoA ligase family protein [Candidatus Norongarragalinales archaeon]